MSTQTTVYHQSYLPVPTTATPYISNTELNELQEIVIEESVKKTTKTAIKLFGKPHKEMTAKIELKIIDSEWLSIEHEKKDITDIDLSLFRSAGKLILMDSICEAIKQNNPSSYIVTQWEKISKESVSSLSDEVLKQFWIDLDATPPNLENYLDFNKRKKEMKSNEIAETIVTIFQQTVAKAVEKS